MLCRWQDFTLYGGLSDVPGLPGGSAVKNAPAKITDMKNKRYNFKKICECYWGFPGGVKESAWKWRRCKRCGLIPTSGRSPEGGNDNDSSILAWGIPWTEEPGGLQSMGSQRVRHDWETNTLTFTFIPFLIYQFPTLLGFHIVPWLMYSIHSTGR